jgi:hypothetical protein
MSKWNNSWTDFHEIRYWVISLGSADTFRLLLKSYNKKHFTWSLYAFLCEVVTIWGIHTTPVRPRWEFRESSMMTLSESTQTFPSPSHQSCWAQTTLISLASFGQVLIQILLKAPELLRCDYVSNSWRVLNKFTGLMRCHNFHRTRSTGWVSKLGPPSYKHSVLCI